MIRDVLTALRTGEPVAIDDYGEEDVRPSADQQIAIEAQDVRRESLAFDARKPPNISASEGYLLPARGVPSRLFGECLVQGTVRVCRHY